MMIRPIAAAQSPFRSLRQSLPSPRRQPTGETLNGETSEIPLLPPLLQQQRTLGTAA